MRRLQEISIILLFLLTGTNSFAQWYGIKGGYNLSKITMKNDAGDYNNQYTNKEGYHIGIIAQFPIKEPFSFETGLLYSSKGFLANWESTYQGKPVKIKSTTTLSYLEIPVLAKTSFKFGYSKIYGALGPYFGIGMSGETKRDMTTISNGETTTNFYDLKFGPDKGTDNLKKVDIGINAGVGIDFSKIRLSFTYGLGMRNLSLKSDNNAVSKNRNLEFSMTYKISYGSFKSPDYKIRIKAVKRTHNQTKLLKTALEDKDLSVRVAAFNKLNPVSLNKICNLNNDPALTIAAKIRLNKTTWSDEFKKGSDSNSSLGDVIGAAALVIDPKPAANDVVSACHKFISQGDNSRIPELKSLLMRFGNVPLSEDYLNCGNAELYSAGAEWLQSHGYNIVKGNGSNRVRWGENKK